MNPSEPCNPNSLPLRRILVFSLAAVPASSLTVALFVYLPPYFASHLGVPLSIVGGAWALVRILDLGVDPVLGIAMDHTRTRFGRYRVWMSAGAPIFMAGIYMLFMAPKGIGGGYIVFWLLVMYLGLSILSLAHSAWAASLAPHYHERSRLFGILAAVGVAAAVAILIFPIAAKTLHGTAAESVRAMGLAVVLVTPFAVGTTVARTPEPRAAGAHTPHFAIRDYARLLTKPELVRLISAQMSLTLGPGWMSALYLFFFVGARGYTAQQATSLLVVYILAGVAGAPLMSRLARRAGKHRTLIAATTAYSLGLCTVLAIPRGSVAAALPMMFWCGFMAAGFDLMIRAMIADVGDEIRLEQGKERISLLYALITLAAKIAGAVAIALTYPLLDHIGYKAAEGATNTHQAIVGLEWAFLAGPIVFVMLGGACVLGWKLDAARHAKVRAALDAIDARYTRVPAPGGIAGEAAPVVMVGNALSSGDV